MTTSPLLAIGPANFAGQAAAWASAAREYLHINARSFAFGPRPFRFERTEFGFPSDIVLPHPRMPSPLRAPHLRRALRGVTHVALDGFWPLRGRIDVDDIAADLRWLEGRGVSTALIAHGSDVRDPDLHMQTSPTSYFRDAPRDWVAAARTRSRRNRALALTSGLPLFVSTPDLCNDLPGARWLPLSVAVRDLRRADSPALHSAPLVLHVPSRAVPPIKGTAIIEPTLAELDARGAIRWMRSGVVTHSAFLELVRKADIVIDQVLGGSYGVTTVEAMAAGAVVIGNIEAHTLRHMPDAPPVVQAAPQALSEVLSSLAADPGWRLDVAAAQARFVRKWHDGRAAAAALEGFASPHSGGTSHVR